MKKSITRLTIEVSEESYFTLRKYLPHGAKSAALRCLVDNLARVLNEAKDNKERGHILSLIQANKLELKDILDGDR